MLDEGSLPLAIATALVLIGGLVSERVLLTRRWGPYYAIGLPLPDPVPIPKPPTGEGKTATVRWEVRDDVVRFWAEPGDRAAPSGLHGQIRLLPMRSGSVGLSARWSPPWSYLAAAAWLVVLGAWRDQLPLTASIAVVLVGGVLLGYRRFAERAVRELRWAFTQQSGS